MTTRRAAQLSLWDEDLRQTVAHLQYIFSDLRQDNHELRTDNQRLTQRIVALETQITTLQRDNMQLRLATLHAPPGAASTRRQLDRALRRLLTVCHPDKWQGHAVAEALTKAVLDLRERLKEGQL
jgi:hypothetical protein